MTKKRIENALKIIKYAIENHISVKKASELNGYANTYVKNIKAVLLEEYNLGIVDDKIFSKFSELYEEYLMSQQKMKNDDKDIVNEKPNTLPPDIKGEQEKYSERDGNATYEWKYQNKNNFPQSHIKTLDDLMSATNVDLKIWNVKNYVVNKWDVTSWKSGEPITVENFQIKASLVRDEEKFKYKKAAELFIKMTNNYKAPQLQILPQIPTEVPKKYNHLLIENNLLEICIFDLHIGKLAWGGETGENYDVKIASKRFMDAITILLYRASSFKFNKILFPIGNDFFNSDNMFNTTTKGTQQDEDLRWQKTFHIGTRLLVDGINLLKQIGVPIEVVVIPGNHDFEKSFYMGEFLTAWFDNDSQVVIDNGASPRKYKQFGNVLLGFTHGNEEKEGSLPLIMASDIESKKLWSDTKYHEWHLGHTHRKKNVKYAVLDKGSKLNEDLGVTVRYMSSLTGTEEWHHKKGFIGQTKAADAFIWNNKNGLIAHLNSTILI